MRVAIATLESVSPYSQSRFYDAAKLNKELPKDYETRTWRDRMHTTADGNVFIPPMQFKNCLSEVAKYLSVQIPGKGKSTYTKNFEAGVIVTEGLILPLKKEDVPGEWLHVPSDGRRGGGKRVLKCFPRIDHWEGDVVFHVLDDLITPDIFEQHLTQAGQFIGIGRFRPRNNGMYGRFTVKEIAWED
jgi:hypothetical protein